jgi:hypothetical protein
MMLRLTASFLVVALLSSCGGGGGGNGGGSSLSSTGVRLLHGAIDAAPVDLVVDNDGVVATVPFGETVGYHELSEGVHAITAYRTKDLAVPLFSRSITSDGDQKFTVLLHGDRGQFGLRYSLIKDEVPVVPAGSGLVRLIHGVIGASSIRSTGSASVEASFGAASDFVTVPAGAANFRLARVADGATLARAEFVVEEGRAYSLFLGGEADYLVDLSILDE